MKTAEKKQKAIEGAYGDHYEKVKQFIGDDGWCVRIDYSSGLEILNHESLNDLGIFQDDDLVDVGYDHNRKQHIWRPKTLENFEKNNGWKVINSEEDLPRENMQCFIMQNGNVQIGSYISNYKRWFAPGCYYSETYKNLGITHYQPIEKPKKPIY